MGEIKKVFSVRQEVRPVMKVLLARSIEHGDRGRRATCRGYTKNPTPPETCKQNNSIPVPRSHAVQARAIRKSLRGTSINSNLLEYRKSRKRNESTIRGPERRIAAVRPRKQSRGVRIEVPNPEHVIAPGVSSGECHLAAVRRNTEKVRGVGKYGKPFFFRRADRETNRSDLHGGPLEVGDCCRQRRNDDGDGRQRPSRLFPDSPSRDA